MADSSRDAPNLPSWPLYMMMSGQAVGADSFCKYPNGGTAATTWAPSPGATGTAGSMGASLNGVSTQPASVVPVGGTGSFYFSFCGTDGLMIGDTADTNLSTSYANAVTSSTFSASNTTTNSQAVSLTTTSATVVNGMQLAAVNREYFYGIPTPSVPNRADCASSSVASNCSSMSDHHAGEYGTAVPPPMPTSSLVVKNSAASPDGVQKDVLALMAAEQQQQKFVLQQRNVYMSGLPVNFRPPAFRAMCAVFGRIESSKLCMEADDSSRCRGFGFVLFYDVESATSCISSLNGKMMQGRTLQVRRADLSAAPQPLHPVTQRNRTGSGLVTPPSQGQQTSSNVVLPGPPVPGLPVYSPHPSPVGQPSTNPIVMSAVPFTYATPTGATPPLGSTSLKSVSTANSFLLGASTPASSSLGATSTPTVMYASNSTIHPTMRGGVPVMQLITAVSPGSTSAMVHQPLSTISHTSPSGRDGATSQNETPSSLASSCAPTGFSSSSQHLIQLQSPTTQQQQQQQLQLQQQHGIPVTQLSPVQPHAQSQRPCSACTNMTVYHAPETTSGAGNLHLNPSARPSAVPSAYSTIGNLAQDYLMGVDPTASSSNVYYFISQ
ncbi:hypothetical protein JKF63_04846 [Porcisia hertigi]|uniref:RRM domain-containing protein n=1 Tax=Porcisia hertigi TaxID=2761500 RepID=A0A836LDN6_9TRYP|nr:hypothetical protein JKF63_04846 [Porcisia hertigi]